MICFTPLIGGAMVILVGLLAVVISARPVLRLEASAAASYFTWPTALAASLVLLVGGGLGWFMHGSPQRDETALADLITFGDGSLQAEGALAQLLETVKSGAVVSARDVHGRAWQLKTIFSFRAMANLPCRRYELTMMLRSDLLATRAATLMLTGVSKRM
jgi:hypothetical protein